MSRIQAHWMPRSGRLLAGALVLVLAGLAEPNASRAQGRDGDIISLQLENDLFGGTDRHFTHGTRIAFLSSRQREESVAAAIARWLPCIICEGEVRYGVALGQSIFTPDDISRRTLIEDDRPFAGWLFGTFSLLRGPVGPDITAFPPDSPEARARRAQIDQLESFELTLGVVGPSSYAEHTQKFMHEIVNARDPNGWDNQLEDEAGIILSYETRWRSPFMSIIDDFGVDVLPSLSASVGNVFTSASASLTFRLGGDLSDDFGPPRIRPSLPGSEYYVPSGGFGWYIFAGVGARAVARNIFLDGNTFRESHSVDKKPFVFDLQVGIVFSLWGRARLSFTNIFRTREFDGQNEGDEFGAVSLSFRF